MLSLMRAPSLWRVTLHGEAVLFRVSYGTSGNITIKDVMAPARFVVPGSCDVYAYPYRPYEDGAPTSHAEVTATPATSGSAALLRVHRFGLVVPLDPNAARFVALVNSVVVVGPGLAAQSVNLLPLESVLLTSGSVLTSGDGYLEFEP